MNQVQLLGYVANDPWQAQKPDKVNPTLFNLIVHDRINGRNYKQFVPCKAWAARGESVMKWLKTGSRVVVEGRLTTSVLKDEGGQMIVNAEVQVNRFWLVGEPSPKTDRVETDGL